MIITRNKLITTADIEDRAVTRAKLSFDTLWKVARIDVTSDATQADFTGLDGDSDGLYILVFYIKNTSGTNANYGFRFNDDTGTNYNWRELHGAGNDEYTSYGTGVDFARFSNCETGHYSFGVIWLCPKTGQQRLYSGHYRDESDRIFVIGGEWTNTADNITKISLVASETGAISAGSWFILYKLGL